MPWRFRSPFISIGRCKAKKRKKYHVSKEFQMLDTEKLVKLPSVPYCSLGRHSSRVWSGSYPLPKNAKKMAKPYKTYSRTCPECKSAPHVLLLFSPLPSVLYEASHLSSPFPSPSCFGVPRIRSSPP